eukprot:6175376-Pleurochrysis_carterae.AAC.6
MEIGVTIHDGRNDIEKDRQHRSAHHLEKDVVRMVKLEAVAKADIEACQHIRKAEFASGGEQCASVLIVQHFCGISWFKLGFASPSAN